MPFNDHFGHRNEWVGHLHTKESLLLLIDCMLYHQNSGPLLLFNILHVRRVIKCKNLLRILMVDQIAVGGELKSLGGVKLVILWSTCMVFSIYKSWRILIDQSWWFVHWLSSERNKNSFITIQRIIIFTAALLLFEFRVKIDFSAM